MAIYNLGSINIDHVYRMEALPRGGETVAALSLMTGLGGKGANQSIAAAQAGASVLHIGCVGEDGVWAVEELNTRSIITNGIRTQRTPTGHAIINVDDEAENAIVLFVGANGEIASDQIDHALTTANKGDWLLLQNETNNGVYAAQTASKRGLKVVYSAAPFSKVAVDEILPHTDLLVVNELEAQAIRDDVPNAKARLAEIDVLVTKGKSGAQYLSGSEEIFSPAYSVDAVDTTGAGDTYLGYFLAGIDLGLTIQSAMQRASAASAIQVTREGAATAIPDLNEVLKFMENKP